MKILNEFNAPTHAAWTHETVKWAMRASARESTCRQTTWEQLPIQGQGHFRHSALWVSVTCLIACQGAHLSQFASGKNKPNSNNSKKTGSTCLFCGSLMGRRRRRQRRSTLVWPKRRRQLFKFGRVQKLCSLCLGPFTRHWQTPWASRESTPLESNGDVASGANAEDDTGNGIGFALGSWRHAVHNTNYTYNTNERVNIYSRMWSYFNEACHSGSLRRNT